MVHASLEVLNRRGQLKNGAVGAIRDLELACRSARNSRVTALNQLQALLVSGPGALRSPRRLGRLRLVRPEEASIGARRYFEHVPLLVSWTLRSR